jgi:hypothetical protein
VLLVLKGVGGEYASEVGGGFVRSTIVITVIVTSLVF